MGSRILHQRLKGASIASYYPPRIGAISQLRKLYPNFHIMDEQEEDWLEHLNVARSRGKAPPKKKRTAAGEWGKSIEEGAPGGLRTMLTVTQNRRSSIRGGKRLRTWCRTIRKLGGIVHWPYRKASGMAFGVTARVELYIMAKMSIKNTVSGISSLGILRMI
jgi:hypothetical protein